MPPDTARIDAAREKLHGAFADRLETQDIETGRRLVAELREKAGRAKRGDPTHYVLMEEVVLVARRCHDAPLWIEAFDELIAAYDVDLAQAHLWAFDEYEMSDDGKVSGVRIAERCLRLSREVARREDFDRAKQLRDVAERIAKSIGFKDLRTRVKLTEKEAGDWRKLTERGQRAHASEERPLTPRASLDVARYLLAVRNDWDTAVPYLRRSPNASFVALVERDKQQGGPDEDRADRATSLDLARAWRDVAARESTEALREAFFERSRAWYLRALELTTDVFDHDELVVERDAILAKFGPPRQFLADFPELEVHAPFGELGKDGWLGMEQDDTKIGGLLHMHCLALHAGNAGDDAKLRYDLGRAWSTLRGSVALNDTSSNTSSAPLVFQVFGDSKLLWASKVITTVADTQTFEVKVKGVKDLQLVIQCDGVNRSAHSVWVDPLLER